MPDVTVIGRGANVVGTVSGAVDLSIHGRVEGDVSVEGDVTVETEGLVAASVSGRRVIVRGAIKGDVTAEDAIRLEEGARVVGDLHAPRVSVTRGALVRGYVQTSSDGAQNARPRTQTKTVQPTRRAPLPRTRTPSPIATPEANVSAVATRKGSAPSLLAGGSPKPTLKRPPPPVVPVLRKGVKGTLKKRAG